MRILQLVTRRQHRGAEVFASQLSEQLADRGHEVIFAGLNPPAPESLSPAGVRTDDITESPPASLSLRITRDLIVYLRRIQPDVVQANGGYAMKYAALAKRFGGGGWPIVYCNIGLSSDWLRRPGQRIWNRWLLGHAAVTAAVSEASGDDLIKTYGLQPDSVVVVRRGVDTEAADRQQARESVCRELQLPDDAQLLLHVGSFTREKNHEGLLRIFEQVQTRCPSAHLLLVGDGPLYANINAEASGMSQVRMLGTRSDIARLMAATDLLLLPSLTEGIPGVVLEAGAQSLTTVAYDVGGVVEAIDDGHSGRVVEAGDEQEFVGAVCALLRDQSKLHSFGLAARQNVLENYSLERSVNEFESLYRRSLGDRCALPTNSAKPKTAQGHSVSANTASGAVRETV